MPPSQSLIGKGREDLVSLLGKPGLVRQDRGVEVWQYARGNMCVLMFYLYDTSGAMRVTYLEAMPQGLASSASAPSLASVPPPVTSETCLAEQLRAAAAKPAKKTS